MKEEGEGVGEEEGRQSESEWKDFESEGRRRERKGTTTILFQ